MNLTITDAGRAALLDAQNGGFAGITISSVVLGSGQYEPQTDAESLVNPITTLTTVSGIAVSSDVLHLTVIDSSRDTYSVGEIGLMTDTGVLFALYSQPDMVLFEKSTISALVMALDVTLVSINTGNILVGNTNFLLPPGSETVPGVLKITSEIIDDASVAASAALAKTIDEKTDAAQNTAESAVDAAAAAQNTAESAFDAAAAAQNTADSAILTANSKFGAVYTTIWTGQKTTVDLDNDIVGGYPGNGFYLVTAADVTVLMYFVSGEICETCGYSGARSTNFVLGVDHRLQATIWQTSLSHADIRIIRKLH